MHRLWVESLGLVMLGALAGWGTPQPLATTCLDQSSDVRVLVFVSVEDDGPSSAEDSAPG